MMPAVYAMLSERRRDQGNPSEGWVFPSRSECGHLVEQTTIFHHRAAVKRAGLKPFPTYTLRHTALTRLAEAGCDAFTLARIAGHSSVTIT